jgi:enoyl-CoA hydratase/carnithine racemase
MPDKPELTESTLDVDGRVATLTLDRPNSRNILTGTRLVDDIVRTVDWVNGEDGISVLILTGAGPAFSAGGNIKDVAMQRADFAGDVKTLEDRYRRGIQRMPVAMQRLEVPVIAAINGAAIGAGLDLACMCDMRLASSRALFGEVFVELGLIPGDGGAWFLQRLVGYQRAAELTLTGRTFDAAEAHDMGLVLEVCEPSELMPRARQLADRIAAHPTQAVRYTKRLLQAAQRHELGDFLDLSAAYQAIAHQDPEHRQAALDRLIRFDKRR